MSQITVEANGARLYAVEEGSGEPLVFVHAGIADSRMWQAQTEHFADRYRVIRYDMRGYGQSPPVDGEFRPHDDLRAVLDHFGVESAHVVGCSMGGSAALDFALDAPERVRSLTLVCSLPNGYEGDPDDFEEPEEWPQAVEAWKAGDDEAMLNFEARYWLAGAGRTLDEIDPDVVALLMDMNRIALTNERNDLGTRVTLEPAAAARLRALRPPLLAITGAHDEPFTDKAWNALIEQVPQGRKVRMEGVAHLPSMERPDAFNRVLEAFLTEHG